MTLSSLTITLSDPRLIDGWVEAANRNNTTPEAIAGEFLQQQGRSYADLFGIGVITSSAFIRRFTAAEYGAILAATEQSPEVASLVNKLTESLRVVLDDPRLEPGLMLLAAAGLIDVERVPELLAYERPKPTLTPEPDYAGPILPEYNPDGTPYSEDWAPPEPVDPETGGTENNDTSGESEEV